jgi:hypothetical protein
MTDYAGTIIPRNASSGSGERIQHGNTYVFNSLCSLSTDLVIVTEEDNFTWRFPGMFRFLVLKPSFNGNVQSRKTPHIVPLTLSTQWLITPEHARRTVSNTTQWGCECP